MGAEKMKIKNLSKGLLRNLVPEKAQVSLESINILVSGEWVQMMF